MKKLGFIGVGNMGGAIIGGILRSGKAQPGDIIGADKSQQSAERAAKQYSIEMTTDNRQVAQNVSILFLSVKPQFLDGVIEEIRDVIREDQLVVSIVAGRSLSYFKKMMGEKARVVRLMPNTPVQDFRKVRDRSGESVRRGDRRERKFPRLCVHVHGSNGGCGRPGRHAQSPGL